MKNKTKFLFASFSVLLAALSVLTINLYLSQRDMKKSLADAAIRQTSMNENQTPILRASFMTNDEGESFVDAAESTVNTVVHIRTEIVSKGNSYYDFFGSLLEQLYGGQMQVPNNVSVGYGSGVVISPDGYIVTNNHVVEGASKIEVTFNDKHKRTATIIGNDPSTDLALIKVDAQDLEYLTFADSDKVRVGEWVLAVGNPFNLTSTVTAGIVSAKARSLGVYNGGIESFIQTDAAINQGNSGGALVNAHGELVGINAVLSSPTGAYAGYGFAIPTSIMTKVVSDLKEFGTVQRAILGISGHDLDDRTKDKDLGTVEGVYVAEVTDGSGAKAAGIEAGDVIIKIAGKKIHNMAELQENLAMHRPGDKVEVTILRGKKEKTLDVTLKNLQGNTEVVKKFDLAMLGAAFKPISDDVKRHLGVSYGLEVTGVDKGKFAEAGIKKGFIILKVNGNKITSEEDLANALKAANQSPERVLFISGYYMSGRRANYAVELSSEE